MAVRKVDGRQAVTALAFTLGRPIGTSTTHRHGGRTGIVRRAYKLEWKEGSNGRCSPSAARVTIVTEKFAKKRHLKAGSPFTLRTPTGQRVA